MRNLSTVRCSMWLFICEILPIMRSSEAKPKFHSFGNFFSETGGGKEDLRDAAQGCLEGGEVPVIADSGAETSRGVALTIHGDKHRAGRATGNAPTGRVAGIADKDLSGRIAARNEICCARRKDHETAVAADRVRRRVARAIRGGASRSDGGSGRRRGAATRRSARRMRGVMDKADTCDAASGQRPLRTEYNEAAVITDRGKLAASGERIARAVHRNHSGRGRTAGRSKCASIAQINLLNAAIGSACKVRRCRGKSHETAVGTDGGLLRSLIAGNPRSAGRNRCGKGGERGTRPVRGARGQGYFRRDCHAPQPFRSSG